MRFSPRGVAHVDHALALDTVDGHGAEDSAVVQIFIERNSRRANDGDAPKRSTVERKDAVVF